MKTILYNPIFINPQAYYVFPRLTRYLQPDNESTAEPANYIGTIEVKVIAYGDTTLKRTYTNTDSIDLSEFKNTWIRISLFTKVGSCVLGEWKIGNMESDLPYIDPEVLASLKAVVIVGNKTNNDSDRAIVKNLVDPDNPFVISNAAYTEGSGYADKDSPYYGAFVTDGIDDLITSTKTVQEMLGGSNEITVVSMAHFIKGESNAPEICRINQIRRDTRSIRNSISKIGKSGIFGYTYKNGVTTINNILGDKNDCTAEGNLDGIVAPFSVEGYYYNNNSNPLELCSIAWYWTIIANKVLTTDQINQVIAYFNLDRTLKPDILCNTIKQGITNENHAEFGDKLIDFSGNGRDIQLNNLAWKGGSGIAAKQYETFKDWTNTSYQTSTVTEIDEFTRVVDSTSNAYWVSMINRTSDFDKVHDSINIVLYQDDMLLVHECKYKIDENVTTKALYETLKSGVNTITLATIDKFTDIPEDAEIMSLGEWVNPKSNKGSVKITLLPSYKGGLLLDGVNDFGKVTGMPIYKDYTFIIDYERISYTSEGWGGAIVSKSPSANNGAFISMMANSAGTNKQLFSFGGVTAFIKDDLSRILFWQTKYKSENTELTVGEGVDGDTLWLGTLRDNDSRFFNGAIYSLMSFPYSMSEFLIERQLKKHKLGTLYPNMVEFRPVIKSSVELVNKPSFAIRGTSTLLNAGDYIPENSEIWVVITMNNVADRITKFVINGNTIDIPSSAYNPSTMKYGFPFTIDSKSPQKITMTIEQDENYVLFNPVINSNYKYISLDFFLNNYQKKINIGDYIPKDAYLRANLYLNNNVDEPAEFTFNGVSIGYSRSITADTAFNIGHIYNYDSPQEVNITIDEYIRYEDIVQPYPVLLRFNDENGNEVSWGGKFRVGSTITRIGSFYENNLIDGLYIVRNPKLNGNNLNTPTHVVEKSMVFTCDTEYLLDNNEPKCILSPSRLRMPNSSYKILGYIPDISGHGNHGKINNSAYAGMSGVNGYPVVFGANETWENLSSVYSYTSDVTSTTIHITRVKNAGTGLLFSYVKKDGALTNIREIPAFRVTVKGLEGNSKFGYRYLATEDATVETLVYLGNGTHELSKSFTPTEALLDLTRNAQVGIFITPMVEGEVVFDCDITIEVLPEYEGAYCLDGVDDFVTIPTTVGGKQVLMKVNWDSSNSALLYDQRGYNNEFAIYNGSADSDGNPIPAYQGRNNGQTYIDGILNSNIKASELRAITHNITITNELSAGVNKFSPVIGSNRVHNAYFTNMALYDFMLFDNISTDDKIKQLNEYVGIEGNTEWRKTK